MKLNVSTPALLAHLAPCVEVTNRRAPSYFGQCVLLTATDTPDLTIQAYNMPLSMRAHLTGAHVAVSAPGCIAVPADELLDRIKAITDEHVTLSSDDKKLTIKGSGARKYTLRCSPGVGFPAFPKRPDGEITVPGDKLALALRRVAYAAADDGGAFPAMFAGVAMVAANDTLTTTASNSHRIARASEEIAGQIKTFVPLIAVKAMLSMLGKTEARIASSDSLVYFAVDGIELTYGRLSYDGPAFDQVIAMIKATDGPTVDRKTFIAAIKGLTVDGTAGSVPVEIKSTGKAIELKHTSKDGDESTDEIAVASEHKWRVAAEAKYLLEALAQLDSDTVRMCVCEGDMQQPIVLRADKSMATIARCTISDTKVAA